MKASPSAYCKDKGDKVLPLEEAVWQGHEKIARLLLLENGASNCKIQDYGFQNEAIAGKLFSLV